ncbi:hypothetical protein [Bifidobacterium sp. ESL0745]|nr:hypothetical protein [Bifidobacterium sp. ESL0745]MDF7665775.1 hypothetical protein [Bifidobacterium sp. ESL0745]
MTSAFRYCGIAFDGGFALASQQRRRHAIAPFKADEPIGEKPPEIKAAGL